jgi:hypothetical protein
MATNAPASVETSRDTANQEVPAGASSVSVPIARVAIVPARPEYTSFTASAVVINDGSDVITASRGSHEYVAISARRGQPRCAFNSGRICRWEITRGACCYYRHY